MVVDPIERIRELYGDEIAERMQVFAERAEKEKAVKGASFSIDPRPIFVIMTTTALLWGKDPRQILTAEVYGKVMDLMNMFFKDK